MLNCICIQGRLTADPELKQVGDKNVCEFAIANNQVIGKASNGEKREIVGFFDIRVWGAQADACGQYLNKGRMVNITGELSQQRWEKEGKNHSRVVIIARNVIFLGGKGKKDDEDGPDEGDRFEAGV